MAKRMLIDATHAEETRVVVLDGSRLEDFDVEASAKKQLKGNIYLAKVVRVEPSLQAAFVEYGGNRHGFLAFGEIHPDYYQIPIADRQRLLELQAEEALREEEAEDRAAEAQNAQAPAGEIPEAETSSGATSETYSEAQAVESTAPGSSPERAEEPAIAEKAAEDPRHAARSAGDEDFGEGRFREEFPGEQPFGEQPPGTPEPAEHGSEHSEASPERPPTSGGMDAGWERIAARPASIVRNTVTASDERFDFAPPDSSNGGDPFGSIEPAEGDALPTPEAEEVGNRPAETEAVETGTELATEPDVTVQLATFVASAQEVADRVTEPPSERDEDAAENAEVHSEPAAPLPPPETVGGDADGADEARDRRIPPRFLRNYRIQEVIRRRQILLVQVVKEERGTKGAALTTYLSLAGRYCVLMPNSPRGGGISRKITSAADRRRLKEITAELDLPRGMGLIVRTAGANRPKPEIKRDCEYLMRLWDDIREHTLRSVAPTMIYEEASLIKRAIRDVYSSDIDEVLVDGEDGWKAARDFMRMLMPSHAKKVQMWRDGGMPLFARYQAEAQLDAMLMPTVQLRSGGYLVIGQTEALVAIDVNSGRSTRERNIEETALRTNLEAADEIARQLRLRDLAGLVVIDFIDMESRKHNAMVERRFKEALKNDRARIQIGHISHFGLLEMSRQRLRPSLAETSFVICAHCGGTGQVRSTESAALHTLRHVEEEGARRRAAEIVVSVATPVAMYILNSKRERLREIEARYAMHVIVRSDDSLVAAPFRIDRVREQAPGEPQTVVTQISASPPPALPAEAEAAEKLEPAEELEEEQAEALDGSEAPAEAALSDDESSKGEQRRRRRRRRGRGGRRNGTEVASTETAASGPSPCKLAQDAGKDAPAPEHAEPADEAAGEPAEEPIEAVEAVEDDGRGRRRGRRGGRKRRQDGGALPPAAELGAEQPDLAPYAGPTPANPFGGQAFDVFEVIERAEEQSEFGASSPIAGPPAAPEASPIEDPQPKSERPPPEIEPETLPTEPVFPELGPQPQPELPAPIRPSTGLLAPAAADPGLDIAPEIEPDLPTIAGTAAIPEAPQPTEKQPAPPSLQAANDAAPEPSVKPVLVGNEQDAGVSKRRGWWRR